MAFLASRSGISPGGISLHTNSPLLSILVSAAGPRANKTVSKPSLPQLPGLGAFGAGEGKRARLVLENTVAPQRELTNELRSQLVNGSRLH